MSSVVDTATKFVTKNADVLIGGIGLGISGVGMVMDMESRRKAEDAAKRSEQINLQQIAERRKLREKQEAAARSQTMKEARVRRALIAAQSGGAGVSGSILSAPMLGVNSSLSSALDYQETESSIQKRQFNLQSNIVREDTESAIDETYSRLYKSMYGFGKDALSFLSIIGE